MKLCIPLYCLQVPRPCLLRAHQLPLVVLAAGGFILYNFVFVYKENIYREIELVDTQRIRMLYVCIVLEIIHMLCALFIATY